MVADPFSDSAAGRPGTFDPPAIGIPLKPLLRLQGYRDIDAVRPDIRDAAQAIAERAEGLLEAHVHYRRVRVLRCADGALTLAPGTDFHSTVFSDVLDGCAEVVVFLLTLGGEFDVVSKTLSEDGDILGALFLETAGWLGVEKVTREFSRHLKAQAGHHGLRVSRRMGPGYGDWNLEEQKALFGLFAGDSMPVSLLESCAMIPRMSRSGLYGLLPSN